MKETLQPAANMSRHCCVSGCSNGDYALNKWKKSHTCLSAEGECICKPPFQLFTFPTEKKSPTDRKKWIQLINRQDERSSRLWMPGKQSRVCSQHFKDKAPLLSSPYPTENLGYDASTRVKSLLGKRRELVKNAADPSTSKRKKSSSSSKELPGASIDVYSDSEDAFQIMQHMFLITVSCMALIVKCSGSILLIQNMANHEEKQLKKIHHFQHNNRILKRRIKNIKSDYTKIKKNCSCKETMDKQLLKTDTDVKFFTGIPSKIVYDKLFDFIKPTVQRKWYGPRVNTSIVRKFAKSPKKMGAKSKLSPREEFLMCLMKIRLGLLERDLAYRFNVSSALAGRIFSTWVKAIANVLRCFVFIAPLENIRKSRPRKFKDFPKLHSILDGTEIFIQTPKNHEIQRITWSSYKHHNTAKILICVAPNGFIVFTSEAYGGSISDKMLTVCSEYLDYVDPYSEIMVDKGFNIIEEANSRFINVHVPPGKRGQSQMLTKDVLKTNKVAKLRILVEQVIRKFKSFHIMSRELPINLTQHIDDLVIICAALTNLQKPIYTN